MQAAHRESRFIRLLSKATGENPRKIKPELLDFDFNSHTDYVSPICHVFTLFDDGVDTGLMTHP